MPWKKWFPEDQRVQFIVEATQGPGSIAELCRAFGISRKTGFKWLARYDELGVSGLVDRSRAPHTHPNVIPTATVEQLVAVRQKHPTWGPRKVLAALRMRAPDQELPAPSTVGDWFKRLHLSQPRRVRRRAPPMTAPFGACDGPNDTWCADFKGYFLTGDGSRCDPLTISDAHSRFLLRCHAVARTDERGVRPVFESAFREYGLPRAIRSDNGPPFASIGAGGLSRLSVWWIHLGIRPERIVPGHPEQNGRHERMHRTLKQETARPPKPTLWAQQVAFDEFRRIYNEERPHDALDGKPPAAVYARSPRAMPFVLPEIEYPGHVELRRIPADGAIKWRGHKVYISQALADEIVGIEEISDDTYVVRIGEVELGRIKESLIHLGLLRPKRPKKT
jgi:transposase InsO family protein